MPLALRNLEIHAELRDWRYQKPAVAIVVILLRFRIFHRATCLGRPTALKEARTIRVDLSQPGQWTFLGIIAWPARR